MKSGTVFIVTSGEYSDFGIYGKFKAEKDFSFDAELKSFLESNPDLHEQYHFDRERFFDSLLLGGLVSQVSIPEMHIDDYSTVCETPEADWESLAEASLNGVA